MATTVVALGSNIGDRRNYLSEAKSFLEQLSDTPVQTSSIYITEPVGPSERDYFNAIAVMDSQLPPEELIDALKKFEEQHGRQSDHPKWEARTIDLDIISYGNLVINTDTLIIPHPEYHKRLFVLKPLQEVMPDWEDPRTGIPVTQLISQAPELRFKKSDLRW